MRISDWSSDVCSSDLLVLLDSHSSRGGLAIANRHTQTVIAGLVPAVHARSRLLPSLEKPGAAAAWTLGNKPRGRSEEHTSELQSLMRISYAVFCLKTKNTNITPNHTPNYTQNHTTTENTH